MRELEVHSSAVDVDRTAVADLRGTGSRARVELNSTRKALIESVPESSPRERERVERERLS